MHGFKEFFETSSFVSGQDRERYLGNAQNLDSTSQTFPTTDVEGTVFGARVKGKNLCFNISNNRASACVI